MACNELTFFQGRQQSTKLNSSSSLSPEADRLMDQQPNYSSHNNNNNHHHHSSRQTHHEPPPPVGHGGDMVDIHDVELTIIPTNGGQDVRYHPSSPPSGNNASSQPRLNNHLSTSPPQRPPRNHDPSTEGIFRLSVHAFFRLHFEGIL